ncbi:MAG TPA: hypothetical protein PLW66_11875, partial [Saprospiraceae bacterium]|nr:hypothetical protein [Saprospiraceae bacterium]
MRKHRAPAFLLSFVLFSFLLASCSKVKKDEAYYAEASKYIYAYTSGAIARDEAVRVRFVQPAVGQDQVGQKVASGIFSVSPAIKGDAVWEDDRTIKLQPAEPLPYGQHYSAEVGLKKLFPDAPKRIKTFDFDFSVRTLSFDVLVDGIRAEDPNDLKRQQIVGQLRTSDPADNAGLEKLLAAAQGNNKLTISWSHSQDGRAHDFVIGGVERSNVRSKVNVWWNGSPIGLKKQGGTEVTIPSLDEFIALSARAMQGDEQFALLNFSDPVSPAQELAGLIRLDGAEVRYAIDGNF